MSKKRNCFDIAMVATLDRNYAFLKPGEAEGNYVLAESQFDDYTRGRVCVVGAHTAEKFERVPEGELWIVVSHYTDTDSEMLRKGFILSRTFPQAMTIANQLTRRLGSRPMEGSSRPVVCVLGGATVFRKTIPRAQYMHLQVLNYVKQSNPRYLELENIGTAGWKVNTVVENHPERAESWRTIQLYRDPSAAKAA